ncbi:Mitochondrial beta-keto-acyl synthase [Kalmusia sp. IMI 367209]|nr:Mitochondrial beta-keto-acyl synthase [Kalmusia sp. IMI 367209]
MVFPRRGQAQQDACTAVATSFTIVSFLIVALRTYVRTRMIHNFGRDDAFMIAALVFTIGYLIAIWVMADNGMGYSGKVLQLYQMKTLIQTTLAIQIMYYVLVCSTSSINIVTDIWILAIPIKTLLKIQRPNREKFGLVVVFGLGIFSTIASIVRLHAIRIYTESADPFYDSVPINVWSMVEVNIGIWCASIPALKILIIRRQRSIASRSAGTYAYHSSGKSGDTTAPSGKLGGSGSGSEGSNGLESFDMGTVDLTNPELAARKQSNVDSACSGGSEEPIYFPVVTGLGLVTPLGIGARRTWKRLLDGHCGIVGIRERSPQFAALPSQVAGIVPEGKKEDGGWNVKEWLSPQDERRMARFAQYAMVASEEALNDAGWAPKKEEDLEATGVYMGSGIGSLDDVYETTVAYEKGGYRKVSPLFVPRLLINLAAGHVSMRYGFKGPNHAATTACTTGAHSIGDAARLIQFGDADVMVAGGAESCIHPLAISGFARARSLATDWNDSPTEASRPFDRDRAGFVIGEGAGVVVLEEFEHAKRRGARIYAEVAGYGLSSDAHHMTAPREDGQGPRLAMKHALRHAGIKPSAVDYVNAHATSTPLGDAAENRAIKELLLGEDGKSKASDVNISSTKGAIGHLLGAAGSVEAIFTILALQNNILPPTLNLYNPGDPSEDFSCNYVAHTAQQREVNVALSNSFGFGGTNASLCFSKLKLPFPALAIIITLIIVNLLVWTAVGIVLHFHTPLISTAILSWTLGLRHALDADHISAIDLMTRRLIASGQRPVTVGMFFSLGHSTIVIITSLVVAGTAAAVSSKFDNFSRVGGIIGTSVSAAFLLLLGLMNLYILYKLVVQMKKLIASEPGTEHQEFKIQGGGCLFPILQRLFKLIDRPWKMYPLGVLFGLGFDTSSEIAILGISSIQATKGTSIWLILLFPLLFTAGMCLLDTTDGALMMSLYTSTQLARDPIAICYYSIVLTVITVIVATIIGVVQFLNLALNVAEPEGRFWDGVERLGESWDIVGGAICGAFVVFGGLSVLLYKPWRRRVDQKRMRNATFEPLPTQGDVEVEDGEEREDLSERRNDTSKAMDVSIEPVEVTDAAGPSGPPETQR